MVVAWKGGGRLTTLNSERSRPAPPARNRMFNRMRDAAWGRSSAGDGRATGGATHTSPETRDSLTRAVTARDSAPSTRPYGGVLTQ